MYIIMVVINQIWMRKTPFATIARRGFIAVAEYIIKFGHNSLTNESLVCASARARRLTKLLFENVRAPLPLWRGGGGGFDDGDHSDSGSGGSGIVAVGINDV